MVRPQTELHDTESIPWRQIAGYPEGVIEKILSEDLETGNYARLTKWPAGVVTEGTFSHDFYEEVYVVKGGMIDLRQNFTITEGYYCYRHPGMLHGPYSCPTGCLLFEVRTYPKNKC